MSISGGDDYKKKPAFEKHQKKFQRFREKVAEQRTKPRDPKELEVLRRRLDALTPFNLAAGMLADMTVLQYNLEMNLYIYGIKRGIAYNENDPAIKIYPIGSDERPDQEAPPYPADTKIPHYIIRANGYYPMPDLHEAMREVYVSEAIPAALIGKEYSDEPASQLLARLLEGTKTDKLELLEKLSQEITKNPDFQKRLLTPETPEEFIDPITFCPMTDPVIAVTSIDNNGVEQRTEHVYDRSTFNKFNGICPENRQPFVEVRSHDELKQRVESHLRNRMQRP